MNEPIPEFVDVARWIPLIEPIPDKTCVMPSLSKQPVRLVEQHEVPAWGELVRAGFGMARRSDAIHRRHFSHRLSTTRRAAAAGSVRARAKATRLSRPRALGGGGHLSRPGERGWGVSRGPLQREVFDQRHLLRAKVGVERGGDGDARVALGEFGAKTSQRAVAAVFLGDGVRPGERGALIHLGSGQREIARGVAALLVGKCVQPFHYRFRVGAEEMPETRLPLLRALRLRGNGEKLGAVGDFVGSGNRRFVRAGVARLAHVGQASAIRCRLGEPIAHYWTG